MDPRPRSRRRTGAAALVTAFLAAAGGLGVVGATGSPAAATTMRTLHFAVQTPAGTCDIVGDLYTPDGADAAHRVPAVLTTNGFGGSKDDQAGAAQSLASRGYVVLSYSGLGFGGSGCKITLDDPDIDGRAASQLVSYLGGAPGIAYADAQHTQPVQPLDAVRLDSTDHTGAASTHDPRVGMVGGSYGGEIQFATASVDPRVDTIVPLITWNDLAYSLDPNNTGQYDGVSAEPPGAAKVNWAAGFSALGVADGAAGAPDDPRRVVGCPNFADWVCPGLVHAGTFGYLDPDTEGHLRHASVATYLSRVRVPTLLMQGQADTLFNLNEAAATYQALRQQGTPVKMIWQSWGHSHLQPAPGEFDMATFDPATQYETGRVMDWFDHYLKDSPVDTGPQFAYFRDWVRYSGIATPAYATSAAYPVGSRRAFYLSDGSLVEKAAQARAGSQSFTTPPAGPPTRLEETDVLGSYANPPRPEDDAPGTYARWTSQKLARQMDVVGSPRLTVQVDAPTAVSTQGSGPSGQLVLFVRTQDVAPDGTASDIHALTAPVRVPDVTQPFTVTLPGYVHRFAQGHRLRLVIAGGSVNYRGGLTPTPVTVTGGPGQALTLPVVP